MNISTSSLVGPSLSCQVPVKPYCTHTCVLKKAGQVGREMREFISLLVSSAHGWVYSAADIRAKPEKSTMKNFSSPRKPSYLYMHPKEVQQRQCVCRERYYKKSHRSTGLSSTVGQCEGHIPRVTHGGGALAWHCQPSADQDGLMWMLLFCLSAWFLDLGPFWSSSSPIPMHTDFLAHKIMWLFYGLVESALG